MGKTSLALNITRNAAVLAQRSVAVFSLEISKQALVQRLICSEAKVDAFLISTGQADSQSYQRIAHAMDRLTQANIWIDDTPALPISELRARARRMKAQHNIDMVVVDYLQLMRGGRQESRVAEVSDISSGLKSIAKELNIPVLALSQLSRESERRENRKPQLSDLRDSGSIEQDADVVLFLYRPGMHKDDVDRSVTELLVEKNRNGPTTKIGGPIALKQSVNALAAEDLVAKRDRIRKARNSRLTSRIVEGLEHDLHVDTVLKCQNRAVARRDPAQPASAGRRHPRDLQALSGRKGNDHAAGRT